MILTSSNDSPQLPDEIVQRRTVVSGAISVSEVDGFEGSVIWANPLMIDQRPFPITGIFPESWAIESQI
jgi:hypothetical protein